MSNPYNAMILGVSAGGFKALTNLLPQFPKDLPLAIIIVCHRLRTPDTYLTEYLSSICQLKVQDAENLESIKPGNIYIAPPGYHLLIADDQTFNLTVDPPVNLSRPSIDVSFETAADVYRQHLIGVILTGANSDGASGLKKIKSYKGHTIVQDPKTAQVSIMPEAAISGAQIDFIGDLNDIAKHICEICHVEILNGRTKSA